MKKLFFLLPFILLIPLILFFSKKPSHDRNWQEQVATLPEIETVKDSITIRHVRDWRYDSSTTLSKKYTDRTFNLSNLEKVWFLVEPFSRWDGVAHTYFTFDFKDQPPIVFSVESRREKGEDFNAFIGLFRNYELIYLWGSEQDFTIGRVINQKNSVYMYPLKTSPEFAKGLFLELTKETKELISTPLFYNSLTSNCTSKLADFANKTKKDTIPFHYARVLPGYSEELLYDLGYIDSKLSLDETRKKYDITSFVKEHQKEDNFSELLRIKLHDQTQ